MSPFFFLLEPNNHSAQIYFSKNEDVKPSVSFLLMGLFSVIAIRQTLWSLCSLCHSSLTTLLVVHQKSAHFPSLLHSGFWFFISWSFAAIVRPSSPDLLQLTMSFNFRTPLHDILATIFSASRSVLRRPSENRASPIDGYPSFIHNWATTFSHPLLQRPFATGLLAY